MISAWWLLLIVPVSFYFGAAIMAVFAMARSGASEEREE